MTIQPLTPTPPLTATPPIQAVIPLRVQTPTFNPVSTYLDAFQESGQALAQAESANLLSETNLLQVQANNLLASNDLLQLEASARLAQAAPATDTTPNQPGTPAPPPPSAALTLAEVEAALEVPGEAPTPATLAIQASPQEILSELEAPATPAPAAALEAAEPLADAALVQPQGSTQLQADIAAAQAADTTDLETDSVLAQAAIALQAQQTVLAAMNSGAKDVALLLSGLPAGATANLLGGGWVRVPADTAVIEADALWAFHFNLTGLDVPAVTSTKPLDPGQEKEKSPAGRGTPLTSYGAQGQKEMALGQSYDSTLDILD